MTSIPKNSRLLGFDIKWDTNDPDDTLVVVGVGGNSETLDPEELKELIAALQEALEDVAPEYKETPSCLCTQPSLIRLIAPTEPRTTRTSPVSPKSAKQRPSGLG